MSLDPGALALLDADDRMCLIQAGTSAEDACFDNANLFSWSSKPGAAEMVASFKGLYGVRPMARSEYIYGVSSLLAGRGIPNTPDPKDVFNVRLFSAVSIS